MSKLPAEIPQATFHKRVVHATKGETWVTLTTDDLFKDKTVVIFGLPGAFTPTCSGQQLPGFESSYYDFRQQGIDDIYCFSVNDTFVMEEWKEKGYAEFYSKEPITCKDPDLTQVFTKPSELTGVIYEFINRQGAGFCKDSVKKLMESTAK